MQLIVFVRKFMEPAIWKAPVTTVFLPSREIPEKSRVVLKVWQFQSQGLEYFNILL